MVVKNLTQLQLFLRKIPFAFQSISSRLNLLLQTFSSNDQCIRTALFSLFALLTTKLIIRDLDVWQPILLGGPSARELLAFWQISGITRLRAYLLGSWCVWQHGPSVDSLLQSLGIHHFLSCSLVRWLWVVELCSRVVPFPRFYWRPCRNLQALHKAGVKVKQFMSEWFPLNGGLVAG